MTHPTMKRLYEAAIALKKIPGEKPQSELAALLGTSSQRISNWEIRGISKGGILEAQAAVGCAGAWIEFGTLPMEYGLGPSNVGAPPRQAVVWGNAEELDDEDYAAIPRLRLEASCGDGKVAFHIEEKGQRQAFRRHWLNQIGANPEKVATLTADGDSMNPRIVHGDSIVVDMGATSIRDGKVYVITYQEEWFIKRLFKRPDGGIRITSDNSDKSRYPDWEVSSEEMERVQIIARVVGLSGAVD